MKWIHAGIYLIVSMSLLLLFALIFNNILFTPSTGLKDIVDNTASGNLDGSDLAKYNEQSSNNKWSFNLFIVVCAGVIFFIFVIYALSEGTNRGPVE